MEFYKIKKMIISFVRSNNIWWWGDKKAYYLSLLLPISIQCKLQTSDQNEMFTL